MLKRVKKVARILRRIARVDSNVSEIPVHKDIEFIKLKPQQDSFYFEHENYWEPNVTLALRDILQPGNHFWDIGAHVGGVTRLGSRIVGPFGQVIAAEASISNFRNLNNNIVVNSLSNVFLINAAVWSDSTSKLKIYSGWGGNDSVFQSEGLVSHNEEVKTVTLDDLLEMYGPPDLIKMDIEGAEFNALLGFRKGLSKGKQVGDHKRPVIILEQSSNNYKALEMLVGLDFRLQDLSTGDCFESLEKLPNEPVSNWIAIPNEQVYEYKALLSPFSEIQIDIEKESRSITVHNLPSGRYRIDISIVPHLNENIYVNLYNGKNLISRYHGSAEWLQSSYKKRQFDFLEDGDLKIIIENPEGTTSPVSELESIKIYSKEKYKINKASYMVAP